MTPETLIRHVEESIEKALRHESWIDADVLKIKGFATGVMRRMISNICHLPKENPAYLEAGLYCGASFCAAINNNPTLSAYGIEDFSQNFGEENVRSQLMANLARYADRKLNGATAIFDVDFFKIHRPLITHPIDVYYYDGKHDYQYQRDALPFLLPNLSELSLWIVDDFNWSCVKEGTKDGLQSVSSSIEVLNEWQLKGERIGDDEIWHNAVAMFALKKLV